MDTIETAKIAEALMRSGVLEGRKIAAIKILQDASRNKAGEAMLRLKDAKDYIDTAAAKIAFEVVIRQREFLSNQVLRMITLGNTEMIMSAAGDLRSHIETHGPIDITARHITI